MNFRLAMVLVLLVGCAGPATTSTAPEDAGASLLDAAISGGDAGVALDAAVSLDASSLPDAAVVDAAVPVDASITPDAASMPDAAVIPDAASAPDAAVPCLADTANDPNNCGTCGHVCDLPGAFAACVTSACAVDHCAIGRHDRNLLPEDGCEYECVESAGGMEACDSLDNDCDGDTDEDFDLTSDAENCGTCGNRCVFNDAEPTCQMVLGAPTCVPGTCDPGFANTDGDDQTGCEYACPVFPIAAESCNGLDDNCDGVINEDNPGGGLPCETNCPGGVCLGECSAGTTVCLGTALACTPGAGPHVEQCDVKDNDCDGVLDNGFDLLNDPLNCGTCGTVCARDHATAACSGGHCAPLLCDVGFASVDGDAENGCEYTCPVFPPGAETCNGLDDDCDGSTDEAADIAAQKPPASGCFPVPGSPCAGADYVCLGALKWRCNYGPGVEVDGDGNLAVVETLCNGEDGNCDGDVDESFDVGRPCDNGLLGACKDVGATVCNPADSSATQCDLGVLPDPTPGAPSGEVCNGLDDDCNGQPDDGIADDMVVVSVGALNFKMDRYEASRPDAQAASAGLMSSGRRCVKAGVLPWTGLSQAVAASACAAAGARLCTGAEMEAACAGAPNRAYPYGTTYSATSCNGLENGVGATLGVVDQPVSCATPDGILNLTGNAAEWTSTATGNTGPPQNLSVIQTFGGSYLTPAAGMTCTFGASRLPSNTNVPELGFRCCGAAP